jgi:hypothetical protein
MYIFSNDEATYVYEQYMEELEDRFDNFALVGYEYDKKFLEKSKLPLDFCSGETGDKMYELYKKNPRYWTGERLGKTFGVFFIIKTKGFKGKGMGRSYFKGIR